MHRHPRVTRRGALLSGGALLAGGLWPGALSGQSDKDSRDFHFIAFNDMHWKDEKGGDWFASLAKRMQGHAEKPEFVLLAGDLAEDGTQQQLGAMRDFCKD